MQMESEDLQWISNQGNPRDTEEREEKEGGKLVNHFNYNTDSRLLLYLRSVD